MVAGLRNAIVSNIELTAAYFIREISAVVNTVTDRICRNAEAGVSALEVAVTCYSRSTQ